jgi:hypothetical protein
MPDNLPFKVVRTTDEEIVARANNLLGHAAFETARRLYPNERVDLDVRTISASCRAKRHPLSTSGFSSETAVPKSSSSLQLNCLTARAV